MIRRFIMLLVLLLPLQFSWAAISAYCEHETNAASHHFGHHEHKHQNSTSSKVEDADPASKSGGFDADCGVCHANCTTALFHGIVSAEPGGADVVFEYPQTFRLTLFYSKPERPKWFCLA
jgi:hypothetical protein